MRRFAPILIILALLLGFAVISQAIISVKMLELRVKISRERILNYELSSRVLKEKFRKLSAGSHDDFSSEVKQNVLEASIMNDRDPEALSLAPVEWLGVGVINAVRKIPGINRPLLRLWSDQQQLLMMKYAFFMERNRRFDKALEKYRLLETEGYIPDTGRADERGFVLLHQGYCLGVLGEKDKALERLYLVRDDFSGSHYSQTAIILINLLLEGERASAAIEKEELSNLEKARRYFKIAQYTRALQLFKQEPSLSAMDQYRQARSKEEMGRVKEAIEEYLKIVKKNEDQIAVRLANRRLLLIGNFYGGGKKIKKFAEKKASDIGDDIAVKEIQTAAAIRRRDIIIDEIKENNNKEDSDPLISELGRELEASVELDEDLSAPPSNISLNRPIVPRLDRLRRPDLNIQFQPPPAQPEKLVPGTILLELPDPGSEARLYPGASMVVILKDGRILQASQVDFTAQGIQITEKGTPIKIPSLVVRRIELNTESLHERDVPLMLFDTGGKSKQIQAVEFDGAGGLEVVDSDGEKQTYQSADIDRLIIP